MYIVHTSMPDLYEKILNTLLELRDTAEHFRIRSAQDIKKLIWSKMNGVREPKDLQILYALEAMITDLRQSLISAKEEFEA
jgi:hypothetical protein